MPSEPKINQIIDSLIEYIGEYSDTGETLHKFAYIGFLPDSDMAPAFPAVLVFYDDEQPHADSQRGGTKVEGTLRLRLILTDARSDMLQKEIRVLAMDIRRAVARAKHTNVAAHFTWDGTEFNEGYYGDEERPGVDAEIRFIVKYEEIIR